MPKPVAVSWRNVRRAVENLRFVGMGSTFGCSFTNDILLRNAALLFSIQFNEVPAGYQTAATAMRACLQPSSAQAALGACRVARGA